MGQQFTNAALHSTVEKLFSQKQLLRKQSITFINIQTEIEVAIFIKIYGR